MENGVHIEFCMLEQGRDPMCHDPDRLALAVGLPPTHGRRWYMNQALIARLQNCSCGAGEAFPATGQSVCHVTACRGNFVEAAFGWVMRVLLHG